MATKKLNTTTTERAEQYASRRIRTRVDGNSALVNGYTKDANGDAKKYETTLNDCTCGHFTQKIGRRKANDAPNWEWTPEMTETADVENWACKHIVRVRLDKIAGM
jgi:hypothetical protein